MQLRGLAIPRERVLRVQFCQDLHPSYLSKANLQTGKILAHLYYTPWDSCIKVQNNAMQCVKCVLSVLEYLQHVCTLGCFGIPT